MAGLSALDGPILELSVTGKPYANVLYPQFPPSEDICADELVAIAESAAEAGFHRIILTGTEPLLRADILDICYDIGRLRDYNEFGISTGGAQLRSISAALKGTGVGLLEIRLDTLQKVKYEFLGGGKLGSVLKGISAAEKIGFLIRIMTRLIGGVTDDEIYDFTDIIKRRCFEQWFIELPHGSEGFIPADRVLSVRPGLSLYDRRDGVRRYRIKGDTGRICLASPEGMNRVRVASDGRLFSDGKTVNLRELSGQALTAALKKTLEPSPGIGFDFTIVEE
ncbi:MAG: radical SAM protein [Oscillospiraceae bacterium]